MPCAIDPHANTCRRRRSSSAKIIVHPLLSLLLPLLLVLSLQTCEALVINFPPGGTHVFAKPVLLPIQLPWIPQDPQGVPRGISRAFGFRPGGTLNVDLLITDRGSSSAGILITNQPDDGSASAAAAAASSSGLLQAEMADTLYHQQQLRAEETPMSQRLASALSRLVEFPATMLSPLWPSLRSIATQRQAKAALRDYAAAALVEIPPFKQVAITDRRSKKNRSEKIRDDGDSAKNVGSFEPAAAAVSPAAGAGTSLDAVHTTTASSSSAIAYLLLLNADQWDKWLDALVKAQQGLLPASLDTYTRAEFRIPMRMGVPVKFQWTARRDDLYSLLVINPERRMLAVEGSLIMVNPGRLKHLSSTMSHQGVTLLAAHVLYCATTVAVIVALLVLRLRGTELAAVAALCLMLKAAYLLGDALNVQSFRENGELRPIEWVVPRMFANFQSILLLALFLLVAFGWKVHRSQLSLLETRMLTSVCLLSLYLGVFEVSMGAFQAIRYIIHSLVYLVVLVAVNFDIVLLGSMLMDMGLAMGTAEIYQKREAYQSFRTNFILYVLKPTIDLFYKIAVLPKTETEDWTILAVDNLLDWYILTSVAYDFRPEVHFPLLKDLQAVREAEENNATSNNNLNNNET